MSRADARVGLVSDTHGRLDPRVFDVLDGVDALVHAGDIGDPRVLWQLEGIAPVTAVLGNTDIEVPGYGLSEQARLRVARTEILVIHDHARLGAVPHGVHVVVSGHTHRPSVERLGDVLFVNPGAAFRPRAKIGRTVGVLFIRPDGSVEAEVLPLDAVGPSPE